jgi:hypothetical protein
MVLRWNAKGSTAVNMFAWFTSIAAIMIGVIWFMKHNPVAYLSASERLDEDLWQISQRLNDACTTSRYYSTYNPLNERGTVAFNPGEVCIELQLRGALTGEPQKLHKCATTVCQLNVHKTIDLGGLATLVIDTGSDEIVTAS